MKGIRVTSFLLLFVFLFLILAKQQMPIVDAQAAGTGLYLSPSIYVAKQINETFVVSVNVSLVNNLHSAQLRLSYNSTLLRAVSVSQGTFFPSQPSSSFTSRIAQSSGLVQANVSLVSAGASVSGNGTIACICFRAIGGTISTDWPMTLTGSLLLDSKGSSIAYDSLAAVYFWKSIVEDPSVGPYLDEFSQRAGRGPNVLGGIFNFGEIVNLMSAVTYNGYPVMNKLVAFVALNPTNQTVVFATSITNGSGIASISFRIPNIPSSAGFWTCVSVVEVDSKVVWDVMKFWASAPSPHPVGGYSFGKEVDAKTVDYASYWIASSILLGFVIMFKNPKKTRFHL